MKKSLKFLVFFLTFSTSFLFSHTISIGDEVSMVADKVKVRSCADLSCSSYGLVDIYSIGNIVEGPADQDGYYWWKVNWENGQPDGWTPTPKSGNSWYYEKPEGLFPGGNSSSPVVVNDSTPTLKWDRINGVDHYDVTIIKKSSGDVTYHDNIGGSATSYIIPSALEEGERYLWSVIPHDADDDMGLKAEYVYFDVKIKADSNYDLSVRPNDITIRSASGNDDIINVGEKFDIKVDVHNVGDADSDSYKVKYFYKDVDTKYFGSYFDIDSGSGTDTGDSDYETSDDEGVTGGGGTHWVKVCVYDNDDDADHNNDCGVKSFEVEENGDDPTKPKIDSITPAKVNGSFYERIVEIRGENFKNSFLQKSYDENNNFSTIEEKYIVEYTDTLIKFRQNLFTIAINNKKTFYKYNYRLLDGSKASNIKTIDVNYVPLAPIMLLKSEKSAELNTGQSYELKVFSLDLEDVVSKNLTTYKFYVNWGDHNGFYYHTKDFGESSRTHTYKSYSGTHVYTVKAYALDSDGNPSNIIQTRITVKGTGAKPISDTSFSKKSSNAHAKDSCPKNRFAYNTKSIDKAIGAENFSITPLKVKGMVSVPFTLKYNSLLLGSGDVSKGFSHNYHYSSYMELLEDKYQGKVRLHWDNSNKKYNDFYFDKLKNGEQSYKSNNKNMLEDILIRHDDDSFELRRKNGSVYYYDWTKKLVAIKNYKMQGLNISLDNDGKLKKVEEANSGIYLSYIYNNNGKLKEVKDNTGRKANLYYNSDGLLIKVDYPDGTQHQFSYNETDQIEKYEIEGMNGTKVTYFDLEYKDDGRVLSETDGKHTVSQFSYDTNTKPNRILSGYTDKAGETIKTEYNGTNFNPYHIEYPDGKTEDFTYYSNGKLKSKKERADNTTRYYYDSKGNLEKVKYSDNSEERYEYDDHRNITKKTIKDKNGKTYVTNNTYDANNNLKSTKLPNQVVTTFTYNDNNQVATKIIDSKSTKYRYNTKGYLVEVETPEGLITKYTYDNAGRIKTENTLQSGTTTYTYDVMDNIKTITNQASKTQIFKYDLMGHKTEEKDFNGNVATYKYDANGNMIEKTDAMNHLWKFEYDSADRLSKSYDPLNNYVEYKYDSMGRVIKTIDKRGNATTYSYDAMGNLKTQTDPIGYVLFTHTYDSHNNLIKSVDILNHTTTTDYTVFGKPSQVTDPLQRVTEFKYDAIGRLTDVINAKGKTATQSYNKDGTLKEFIDAGGSTTAFTYDDDGNLITTTTASGSTTTNSYDSKGLVATFKNGRNDTKRFSYDTLGRVTQAKDKDGTIDYTYDDNGNLLTIKENGKTITYTYDALNRVESYVNVWGESTGYEYDVVGNLAKLTYPSGKEVEYSYDENSNLIEFKEGTRKTRYTYDKNNRLIEMTRANGTVLKREYNNAGQLELQTDKTSNGTLISSVAFTYDNVGNIVEETRTPEVAPKVPVNIDMSYLQGNLLDEANQTQARFDADDNMLSFGSKSYSYDSRNRLVSHGAYSYGYDAQNHRVSLTANGSTTKYSINPNAPLSQLLEMTKANGEKSIYSYGLGLLSQEVNGRRLYYHYDLRGSTVALTDESGNIVDRWSYLPYGGQISHDKGSTQTPFLYNGRDGVMTDESGLYYMRARYYDPTIRRFINRDTLLGELGEMATLNRFGYVNGNPVSGVDPLGLKTEEPSNWDRFTRTVGFVLDPVGHYIKSGIKVTAGAIISGGELAYKYTVNKNYNTRTGVGVGLFKEGVSDSIKGFNALEDIGSVLTGGSVHDKELIVGHFANSPSFTLPQQDNKISRGLSLGVDIAYFGKGIYDNIGSYSKMMKDPKALTSVPFLLKKPADFLIDTYSIGSSISDYYSDCF